MSPRLVRILVALVATLGVVGGLVAVAYAQSWNMYTAQMQADWDLGDDGDARFSSYNYVYWANNTSDSVDLDRTYQLGTLLSSDLQPLDQMQMENKVRPVGGSSWYWTESYPYDGWAYYVNDSHYYIFDYYEGQNGYLTAEKEGEYGVEVTAKLKRGSVNWQGHKVFFYGIETWEPGECSEPSYGIGQTVVSTTPENCPW